MNPRPPQPPHALDAEERALARALPRLHGRSVPGPGLDASILAAAEAAVQPVRSARPSIKPRVRWIAPAALAASMVLAVGMAWQLRPLPALKAAKPAVSQDVTDKVSVRMIEPAPVDIPMPMAASAPAPAPAPTVAPARQQTNPPDSIAQEASPLPADRPAQAPVPLLSPAAPPPAPPSPPAMAAEPSPIDSSPTGILDTQSNADAMRVRSNAPAASAGAIARDAVSGSENKASGTSSAGLATPKAIRPAPAAPEVRNEAERAADAGFVDDPGEDVPPATAASPAVRDAWLHRIGELLQQGKRQEAKASLAEFRRRYPAAVLPPALHMLEIEP